MIFAFDHPHEIGDVCSCETCAEARRAPVLTGSKIVRDVPMRILRERTPKHYVNQWVARGWNIPPLDPRCPFIYEVEVPENYGT